MNHPVLLGISAAFLHLAQQPDELDRLIQNMRVVALPIWATTAVVMSLVPLGVAFLGWRRTPAGGTTSDPAKLPPPLRTVRVLGRSYEVADTSGVVLEEKTWTETNVSVSSTPGSVSVHGDQVLHTPGQVHATTTTTRKARLWVRSLDGKEEAWELTDAGFETRPGHIVTLLWRSTGKGKWDGLMAYNHASAGLSTFGDAGLHRAHAIAKFPSWLLTTAIGTGGGMLGFVAVARLVTGTG
ncbi:MAG: hypothetical protein OEW17_11870, partial [Gemmatimonadota bacterium]|nr:hypothetical protein [Gemmatimonadota bacterium]